MQKNGFSYLLHPLFIGALFLLLANDFFFKNNYPNWLTGKLSDVAGLVVLPLFLTAFFPKQKRAILLFTGLFFCWWKSPLSETSIRFLRQTMFIPVSRVVDYTDLFALPALWLASTVRPLAFSFRRRAAQCLQWTTGTLTVFALCATSMPYRALYMAQSDNKAVYFYETFALKKNAAAVLQTLTDRGILYQIDSVIYYPVFNQENLYYRKPVSDSVSTWQQISQAPDSTIFIRREVGLFYIIPQYRATTGANADTLRNIRFTLSENKSRSKTKIEVATFESPGLKGYLNNPTRDQFKVIFKALFSDK